MGTKLSILCDRVIEAGWLVALVVPPLVFNLHSSRIFEPDKVTLLRSIALIMALAWIIKGLESAQLQKRALDARPREHEGKNPARAAPATHPARESGDPGKGQLVRSPKSLLPLFALLFLADQALAAATSIAPHLSLWGSYERLQGLYTTAAYVVVFLSVLTLLRTREQLERLLTVVLVVSLPVSLYGIIQHCGADPVPWDREFAQRVTSTFGNPIFLAAFLVMTVPLTVYRLITTGRAAAGDERRGTEPAPYTPFFPFLRLALRSVLLAAQLGCILLTQSRGPWLGLLSGLLVFALLWTLVRRRWRWAVLITGSSLIVALLLTVIALPRSPLGFMRKVPYLGRFAHVVERTGQVRMLVWQGAVQLLTANPVRAVIGYGPETMLVASYPYYLPALSRVERRNAFPDRSHNETFDVLITAGLVGLAIHLLLFTSLFYYGLKGTGLIHSPAERRVFLGLWLAGGIGAVLLAYLLDHSWRFCGVALPLGVLGGLFVYLGWYGLSRLRLPAGKQSDGGGSTLCLLAVPLLSALAAHFTEITFGIAIATTRTYFWAYAALLVVAGRVQDEPTGPLTLSPSAVLRTGLSHQGKGDLQLTRGKQPESESMGRSLPWSRPLIAHSLLASLILITLACVFLSPEIKKTHVFTIVWLLGVTWVFAGLIVLTETLKSPSVSGDVNPLSPPFAKGGKREARGDFSMSAPLPQALRVYGVYAGLSLLGVLAFAVVYAGARLLGSNVAISLVTYYTFTLLTMLAIGGALLLGERLPSRTLAGGRGLVYPVLGAVTVLVIIKTNVNVVRADMYHKQAWLASRVRGQPDLAISLGRRALALEPGQDFYYFFLGDVLMEKAKRSGSPREREQFFGQAEQALLRARDLNPLKLDHTAGLARLHQIWARHTTTPAERTARLRQSLVFYRQAAELSPRYPPIWNEWGTTYLLLGDATQALEKYQHSLALDDTFAQTYLHLGALFTTRQQWQEAARAYEAAVTRDPASIQGHRDLAVVYGMMGRLTEAERHFQQVLALAPNDLVSHKTLAQIYHARGQFDQALAHARRALTLAPPNERPSLEALMAQLRQQRQRLGNNTPSAR